MIKDFMEVRPNELKPGDVLVCQVTLHVTHHTDENDKPYFRMYKCKYEGSDVPQGTRIYVNEDRIAEALFPVVKWSEMKSDA